MNGISIYYINFWFYNFVWVRSLGIEVFLEDILILGSLLVI